MLDFIKSLLRSDYLERDPYRKFTVALAHAFGGALLVMVGLPLWLVVAGYVVKEIAFDIRSVNRGDGALRLVVADSIVDLVFWTLGALMVAENDFRFGVAVVMLGASYFIFRAWRDAR